jgi:hypothetical protein
VWSARCDAAAGFTSAAKTSSMIAFARSGNALTVHLRGPETTGTPSLTCPEGWEFFGVDLRLGAYLPLYPSSGLTDLNDALLPTLPGGRILLDNRDWEMPTEQTSTSSSTGWCAPVCWSSTRSSTRSGTANDHAACRNGSRS